jgi:hypothetical protein
MAQAETIHDGDALPAPVIPVRTVPAMPPPVPQDPKLKREYEAFLRLYPELLKTHYVISVASRAYAPTRVMGMCPSMSI